MGNRGMVLVIIGCFKGKVALLFWSFPSLTIFSYIFGLFCISHFLLYWLFPFILVISYVTCFFFFFLREKRSKKTQGCRKRSACAAVPTHNNQSLQATLACRHSHHRDWKPYCVALFMAFWRAMAG